ncbi:6-phosphogluconate dehydrogenase, decarboxylating [Stylophora pistillata]|uniref:6-phosphogluconate dehydrogenase, decarboxylating n=1 Tax=Stylophora pistillata TaxID=50429 RepID=A0A2B4S625_STYPI|nr:6-phosphogluconate dehydrogenase, decarboxylating [Stylophora pistillata]
MGQNLILNMNDHGFVVCAFNRTVEKVDRFLANEAKGTKVIGAKSMEDMVSKLKKPRRVMMLVKAGSAVDAFIAQLVPLLEPGDIIIDGGNSEYRDSIRRCKELESKKLLFVGSGVSGGEDGARYGPSLMPGGSDAAWAHIKPIFQSIAAKVGSEPCCDWVGGDGAGHFVKMVHNGIEYGDMQLICEAYHLMKNALGMSTDEMSKVFVEWNKGELDSFLIEITKDILAYKDSDGTPLVEKIRDSAGQKGTGKWTAISALEYGMPVTLIGESVFARCLSSLHAERVEASSHLKGPATTKYAGDKKEFIEHIRKALYASKIVSYAQGFMLMREAAKEFNWTLNYGGIALMWRGGCIIRSVFLGNIKDAFIKNPSLQNLLLDDFFKTAIHNCQDSWRKVVAAAVTLGIPTPAFSTALAFYDGYRSARLPANLIQAQRDYFGAHTYELLSKPGHFVHTNWTGHGGSKTVIVYSSLSGKFSDPLTFEISDKLRQRTVDDWNDTPRKSRPPEDEMHEKWIVLTTVNPPTADVKKLAGIEGWKVVVVGDTKTPADWRYPNCIFLRIEKRKTLSIASMIHCHIRVMAVVVLNSFTIRKCLRFLRAQMEALNQSENNSTEDEEVIDTITVNAGASLSVPESASFDSTRAISSDQKREEQAKGKRQNHQCEYTGSSQRADPNQHFAVVKGRLRCNACSEVFSDKKSFFERHTKSKKREKGLADIERNKSEQQSIKECLQKRAKIDIFTKSLELQTHNFLITSLELRAHNF